MGNFKTCQYLNKAVVATFWTTFGKIGLLFITNIWPHCSFSFHLSSFSLWSEAVASKKLFLAFAASFYSPSIFSLRRFRICQSAPPPFSLKLRNSRRTLWRVFSISDIVKIYFSNDAKWRISYQWHRRRNVFDDRHFEQRASPDLRL